MKLNKPTAIRVILLVLAVAFALYFVKELQSHLSENRPRESVLVATTDILPNMLITSENVGYTEAPEGSRMHGTLQDPQLVVGKKATTIIFKGEQILSQKVTDGALAINSNERALGIPVDSVRAVGMTIKPGNKVDIYWYPDNQENKLATNKEDVINKAKLIATESIVLDILNQNSQSVFTVAPGVQEAKDRNSATPNVTVLKVRNEEVADIVTALYSGYVYLVKR